MLLGAYSEISKGLRLGSGPSAETAGFKILGPTAITTNCLLIFLLRYVIGVAWAFASRVATHNSLPVFASNARKRLSVVPPMNTTPAETIEPPRLGVPVFI